MQLLLILVAISLLSHSRLCTYTSGVDLIGLIKIHSRQNVASSEIIFEKRSLHSNLFCLSRGRCRGAKPCERSARATGALGATVTLSCVPFNRWPEGSLRGCTRPSVLPVGGMIPGDIRPGTEWGIMWGFSGDVTLWVLFGGLPGLELKQTWRWRRG